MEPEEAILHVDFQAVPMLPMKRIQVDAASVSFGKEIPSEKFTIQWPEGTTVWDDFTQISYKVGAQGGVSLKDSPHGELAEVSPPDGMSGSNSTDVNDIARADANSVDGKQGGVSEQDTADSSDRSLAHRGIPSVLKLAFALLCFIGLACFARRYYRARNV